MALFTVDRTAYHKRSAIRQIAGTLFGTGIGDISHLRFCPCFTSVVTKGYQLAETAALVAEYHRDSAIGLHKLTGFQFA